MNRLLAITRNTIPYVKEIRQITGSVTSAILMQQLEYWFDKYPDGFFKFAQPCDNYKYKRGDSWIEELGFSYKEFKVAFSNIGVVLESKSAFEIMQKGLAHFRGDGEIKMYCSYYDRKTHETMYLRNHWLVDERLENLTVSSNVPKVNYCN